MVTFGVIGSGGREHALVDMLQKDGAEVFAFPGNPGTAADGCVNININGADKNQFPALIKYLKANPVDYLVVGPEQPLVDGLVEALAAEVPNVKVYGVDASSAQIEADKFFSHDRMLGAGVPQANSIKCYSKADAERAIRELANDAGIVLKARGLTGGKGVSIYDTSDEAVKDLEAFIETYDQKDKGLPGFLVAERLVGEEFSVFALVDGNNVGVIPVSVQDHKRRDNYDRGPNTGGMGAYCPAPIGPESAVNYVANQMMVPVVQEMRKQGIVYKGFMYAGVMATDEGMKILEFNCRMGDPETQAIARYVTGMQGAIAAAHSGGLAGYKFGTTGGAAICVVLSAEGYPDKKAAEFVQDRVITGIDEAVQTIPGIKIYHAGTSTDSAERFLINGGRVLNVTAYSKEGLLTAKENADNAAGIIQMNTAMYNSIAHVLHKREDIGAKALNRGM